MPVAVEDFTTEGWGDSGFTQADAWIAIGIPGDRTLNADGTFSTVTTYNCAAKPATGEVIIFDSPVLNHMRVGRTPSKDVLSEIGVEGVEPSQFIPPVEPRPQPPYSSIYHAYYLAHEDNCEWGAGAHGQWSAGWVRPWTYFHHTTRVIWEGFPVDEPVVFTASPDPLESPDWEYTAWWDQYLSLPGSPEVIEVLSIIISGFGWSAWSDVYGCLP